MPKNPTISLRSRWLSERLKAARLAAGYTLEEVGDFVQLDHTTLSRFERGTHPIRRSYVRDLVDFYAVPTRREREYLVRLAEDAWRKDWWEGDSSDLDMGLMDLTWLESRATKVCVFEPLLVHGLFQAPAYTEALARLEQGSKATSEVTGRIIDIRKRRQSIMEGNDPTRVVAVLEEPALRRIIGDADVMHQQLGHLVKLSQRPHIEVKILTLQAKADPGHHGPFAWFEMPDPYPEIAYVENLAGCAFLENEAKVQVFQRTYDELSRLALSTAKSTEFIRSLMKDLE
jgi:transcriptional regulator with XRE-family HTH domain